MDLAPQQSLQVLKQSGVITSQMIAEICERSPEVQEWLTGTRVIHLLYVKAAASVTFCKSYEEALDVDIINLKDKEMIHTLAKLLQKPKFTSVNINTVLNDSCQHVNSFKSCGKFLFEFGSCWRNDFDVVGLICDGMSIIVRCMSVVMLIVRWDIGVLSLTQMILSQSCGIVQSISRAIIMIS
jgi:hypothetical protein